MDGPEFLGNVSRGHAQIAETYKRALIAIGLTRTNNGAIARAALGFCPKCWSDGSNCSACSKFVVSELAQSKEEP